MAVLQSIKRKTDGGLLVLLALPLLLLLSNASLFLSRAGNIDPWVYFGYFRNLDHHLTVFAGTYYGTRLPWIIPGYLANKLFSPLVANYVLHLGFYYIAVISLYFILKLVINNRVALLASLLMGSYPFLLAAFGWDYIDGAGIAYFLLTMLLLTWAAKTSRSQIWRFSVQRSEQPVLSFVTSPQTCAILFLAGASVAALIYTQTFLIVFSPVLLLYYFAVNRQHSRNFLGISLLFLLLGFAGATMLLGAANKAAGETFFFFEPAWSYAWQMLGQPNPWRISGYSWIARATWLVFPSIIFLTSLLALLRSRSKRVTQASSFLRLGIFNLFYVSIFLIMFVMEVKGNPVFQIPYYASYLIPGMFLALGSQITPLLKQLSTRQFFWLVGGALVFLIVPFNAQFRSLFASHLDVRSILYPTVIIIVAALGVILLRIRAKWASAKSLVFLFVLLGIANFTIVGSRGNVNFVGHAEGKQEFLAIAKSDDIIRPFDLSGDLRFWYSSNEPLGLVYRSVASTRLWGYRLINENFPVLEETEIGPDAQGTVQIPPNTKVVILSNEENTLEKADIALGQIGLRAQLIAEEMVQQGPIKFTMTFIETLSLTNEEPNLSISCQPSP